MAIRQNEILMEAVRQLSLPNPTHKISTFDTSDEVFPRNYVCERTFYCNGGTYVIEEKKFVGENTISENWAKDDAAWQYLKYLKDNKGVRIMDYNYVALVQKIRQLRQMREELDDLKQMRINAYNDKKQAINSSFQAACQELQKVLQLLN